jgi:hypothetical protein
MEGISKVIDPALLSGDGEEKEQKRILRLAQRAQNDNRNFGAPLRIAAFVPIQSFCLIRSFWAVLRTPAGKIIQP